MNNFFKFLMCACILTCSTFINAQVMYSDNFEAYTTGDGIADSGASTMWTTWSNAAGGSEDLTVSEDFANEGTKSIVCSAANDGVLHVGDLETNRYKAEFYMMVPEGKVAYYNILQNFDGGNSQWGFETQIQEGTAYLRANDEVTTYTYTPGEWMKVTHYIDMDSDWMEIYIDEVEVYSYTWTNAVSDDNTGINKFDAINFYAWTGFDGAQTPKLYIDDIVIEQITSPGAPQTLTHQILEENNIELTWTAPAEGTPESYKIIKDGKIIATVTDGLTYTDNNVYPNNYSYEVRAYYGAATGYSATPAPVAVSIDGGTPKELVIYEIFTGTWCGYCPTVANAIDQMEEDGKEIAIIEYHSGDSYETPSTATKMTYYMPHFDGDNSGSFGLPTTIIDGRNGSEGAAPTVDNQKASFEYFYEKYKTIPSVYTITPTVEVGATSGTFDISVAVEQTFDYFDTEVDLHVALTETNIPENWMGQSHVNFVLKSMYPDASGTELSFSEEDTDTHTFTVTLEAGMVKDNCELVFFVQHRESVEIINAVKVDLQTVVDVKEYAIDEVSIYPNPANNQITIASGSTIETIEVFNTTGQLINKVIVKDMKHQMNVSDLSKGIYNIRITTLEGSKTERLVIE